jgi:hypothetical protein
MSEDVNGLERRGLARGLKILLDILFFLAIALGVLWLVGLSVSTFTDYDDGWELDVPVAIGVGTFYPSLRVETSRNTSPPFENMLNTRIVEARGEFRGLHHSLPMHLGESVIFFLFLALFLWVLTLLRRILATTAGGHPFDPVNPRRLNTLGWIILSAAVISSLLEYLVSRWVLARVEVVTVSLSPPINIHQEWILCGLLVLVLAAIWKEAVRMAEEQSLTV